MKTSKWIRDRRAAAGLSQAELGRKVGASQPMISLWERGMSEPPPDILKKLRTVLDGNPATKRSEPKPASKKPEPVPLSREAGEGRGGGASPRRAKSAKAKDKRSGASLDFKDKLWAAADRLRGHMDPGDYKYVVLGLIFLKYISDAFEELHERLKGDPEAEPEERDHYLAENVFWVPREARWSNLKTRAKSPEIGKAVDNAMVAIERENPDEVFEHYSIPAFDEGRYPKLEKGQGIKSNKFLVPEGVVLLSKLNPRIPRTWRPALSSERRSICSTEFLPLLPTEQEEDREYLYSLFSSADFLDVLVSRATGTSGSHQRVRPDDLFRINCAVPEKTARKHYSHVVKPLLDRVALNLEESRTLATLRDALLPKLLSGEIRVKQAEKIVGEAV